MCTLSGDVCSLKLDRNETIKIGTSTVEKVESVRADIQRLVAKIDASESEEAEQWSVDLTAIEGVMGQVEDECEGIPEHYDELDRDEFVVKDLGGRVIEDVVGEAKDAAKRAKHNAV
jgi:hypothetical protein